MLQPWRYKQARCDATYHVQVKVLQVEAGFRTPGRAMVKAEVVRIFRSDSRMLAGSPVEFSVSVLSGTEEPDQIPIGGTIWTNAAALVSAQFMEVFLDGIPPHCGITLWQQAIISAPTDVPTMEVPTMARRVAGITHRVRSLCRRLIRWPGSNTDPAAADDRP